MAKVLLFYKYTNFENPKRILKWQQKICSDLELTGRIIIAQEGINGTVGGSDLACERYKAIMLAHPQLHDMDIKESDGGAECFPKMSILIKDEIVRLGVRDAARIENTGVHLNPDETHEFLKQASDDTIILDTRNDYETKIGTFKNAIIPNIKHFRDFPGYVDENLDQFKDKKVLMFCTGGIRCERATAYLKEKHVAKEVYQIQGGIHRYAEKYPDGYFRGKNYVFDGRIAVSVNDDILGSCLLCQKPCDVYTNCYNAECNKHYISCSDCLNEYENFCSAKCKELVSSGAAKARPPRKKITQQEESSRQACGV